MTTIRSYQYSDFQFHRGKTLQQNQNHRTQKGVVLIFVLLTVSILATLAVHFLVTTNRNTQLVDTLLARTQLRYTARAGIEYGLYRLQSRVIESRPSEDGALYQFDFDGAKVSVRIVPELGRIDINLAGRDLLSQAFQSYGLDEEMANQQADNILHWRGKSTEAVGDSVSDDDYSAADKLPPAHRRFYATDELGSVYGIDSGLYAYLKPITTVYGGKKISVYAANITVFQALGLSAEDVQALVEAREAFYRDETAIDGELINKSPYLSKQIRSRYMRIESLANKDGQSVAIYSVFKKRRENFLYQEFESGTLSGESYTELADNATQVLVDEEDAAN